MDKYLISIDDLFSNGDDELGIKLISFVKNPAIKIKGLSFNQDEKVVKFSTDENKMRIVAPAMIPMDIYRYSDEEDYEYEVRFTSDVIEKIRTKFMKNLSNRENIFNLEHTNEIIPAYILETWIVGEDPKLDKSYSEFGIDVPSGTLMIISQITDKDYYNRLVEAEQYAYSIEGFFGLDEIKMMVNNKRQEMRDANLHPNCRCEIVDGVLINAPDACDYCKEFELKKNKINMEDLKLPDGEHEILGKIYVVKDNVVVEIKDITEEIKAEEVKEEEIKAEEEEEIKAEEEEEIKAEEEVKEEEIKAEKVTVEEILNILQPKFEEIYKMIADISVKIDEKAETSIEDEPVKMSIDEKFSQIQKFLKKK